MTFLIPISDVIVYLTELDLDPFSVEKEVRLEHWD